MEFGVDTNANGILDADEVTETKALCHGTNGEDGQSCDVATNDDGSYTITCPGSEPVGAPTA